MARGSGPDLGLDEQCGVSMSSLRSIPPLQFSRRQALRGILGGVAAAGCASLPLRAASPAAKAKSVIQIWMWGGPSHVDTLDPKPEAGYDYCGPRARVRPTSRSES